MYAPWSTIPCFNPTPEMVRNPTVLTTFYSISKDMIKMWVKRSTRVNLWGFIKDFYGYLIGVRWQSTNWLVSKTQFRNVWNTDTCVMGPSTRETQEGENHEDHNQLTWKCRLTCWIRTCCSEVSLPGGGASATADAPPARASETSKKPPNLTKSGQNEENDSIFR